MSLLSTSSRLQELGLTPFFHQSLLSWFSELAADASRFAAGRVVCQRRVEYEVQAAEGMLRATLSGRLSHTLSGDARPAVGDWVIVERAVPVGRICHVLERQSILRRRSTDGPRAFGGTSEAQALAANVDLCLIVCALSSDDTNRHAARRGLNARRLERYLLLARECRIPALVVVNKADLSSRGSEAVEELSRDLCGIDTELVSAETGEGLPKLRARIAPGSTVVLLGSSGVGKSSLVNRLLGREVQRTAAIREQDVRGRHTTTERELLLLPGGGILIDTPGMRGLALSAGDESDFDGTGFSDIDELASRCRFRDCGHGDEPGCAVLSAVEDGTLSAARLEHARKLQRELLHQRSRVEARLRSEQKRTIRALSRAKRKVKQRVRE
jgi:ribosome biogenesis GTPase